MDGAFGLHGHVHSTKNNPDTEVSRYCMSRDEHGNRERYMLTSISSDL